MPIVSENTCRYNTTYDPSDIRDFDLCAGKMEGGPGARCQGLGQKKSKIVVIRINSTVFFYFWLGAASFCQIK